MSLTYFVHEDADTGKPTGPRAKYLGTTKYGYQTLKAAIRWCPKDACVVERHTDGQHDWSGRIQYVSDK